MIVQGIIGSIAYRFDGDHLRIVRFLMADHLADTVAQGKSLTVRAHKTFEQISEDKNRWNRKYRAAQRRNR